MASAPPRGRPWLLIASALVLLVMLVYVLLGAYLPSRQRLADLEAELRGVYQKEAELQTQLAQALSKPGHELQHRFSTAEPTAAQLEVAEAALAACLKLEHELASAA